MSYLSVEGAGFTKAVISFWFRVPKKSADKAKAAGTNQGGAILDGIVPLVVMGREGTGKTPTHTVKDDHVLVSTASGVHYGGGLVDITAECIGTAGPFNCCVSSLITKFYQCNGTSGTSESYTTTSHTTASGPAKPTNPTFIGVDNGTLKVNFESTRKPQVSDYAHELRDVVTPGSSSGGVSGQCQDGSETFGCDVLCCVCLIIECSNSVDNGNGSNNLTQSPPESGPTSETPPEKNYADISSLSEGATGAIYSDKISVSADAWHHVLISVELRQVKTHGGEGGSFASFVDSASRLFIALDDKNYTKGDLAQNWAETGDNDVITAGAYSVAGTKPDKDAGGGVATYSCEMSVPGGEFGIPAPARYVKNVYDVEMAEFQMWFGKTLDTGVLENRRAFLDYKRDGKGKIIPDKDKALRLRPVKPAVAEKLMGGKPDLLLHGSSKWKKGKNTGAGGDLKPTGKIEKYTPDPSVTGGAK